MGNQMVTWPMTSRDPKGQVVTLNALKTTMRKQLETPFTCSNNR